VLVRYLLSSVATGAYLLRRRPKLVIVTNPPVPGALVTYLWARLLGAGFALDSHPGGFGAQGDRVAARLQAIHRFLVRRAHFVMVTDESWCEKVRAWGGTPIVVHEAPGEWDLDPPTPHERLRVLVVGTFSSDEPVAAVVGAARSMPEYDFFLTGDPSLCPAEAAAELPGNADLIGFLDPDRYKSELASADVVVTLTTEPTSVMRAACEAVYARRPVVLSDWPLGRRLFPYGVHTANDPESLTRALRSLAGRYEHHLDGLEEARSAQVARWDAQRRRLTDAVDAVLPSTVRTDVSLMGVRINNVTEGEAIDWIFTALKEGRGGRVASLNVDILRQALLDRDLRDRIEETDLVLADGTPVLWAAGLQGTPLVERVAVSDMIWGLCARAAGHDVGVLLLGGTPGTAKGAASLLADRYPGLATGHFCPPYGFEQSDTEMAKIRRVLDRTKPGVVFCGFGAPKQERLMAELARRYPKTWFLACGGTFSMVTGDLPKAPAWMRSCALEWLHRLRLEPRRLFGRYIVRDLPFAARMFTAALRCRLRSGSAGR
jgi:exopolysaccharide biosynthesis WecB/TagA/CpsF family protein